MGFFGCLFGSRNPRRVDALADHIRMAAAAKFAGLAIELAECAEPGSVVVLLVADFPHVLIRLNELVDRPAAVPVTAVLADNLSTDIAADLILDEASVVDIIVGQRHPCLRLTTNFCSSPIHSRVVADYPIIFSWTILWSGSLPVS